MKLLWKSFLFDQAILLIWTSLENFLSYTLKVAHIFEARGLYCSFSYGLGWNIFRSSIDNKTLQKIFLFELYSFGNFGTFLNYEDENSSLTTPYLSGTISDLIAIYLMGRIYSMLRYHVLTGIKKTLNSATLSWMISG